MSELLNKSIQNTASATLLKSSNCHAASVHCSYYAVLQKMCDILCRDYSYTADSLYRDSQNSRTGSHIFIKNQIFKNLAQISTNSSEQQHFRGLIENATRKRIEADYKSIVIDHTKSGAAIDISNKIISILANNFDK